MKVSELGEFGLIDLLAEMISASQNKNAAAYRKLLVGIGDDAAAWKGDSSTQLATTDSLFQDVHFRLSTTPWYELGWKALAVNLSDIAAMGGLPQYALVSLALPPDTEVDDVKAMYQGMIELAQRFEVALIGGDTCRAPLVSITVTVLGSAKDKDGRMLTRSAARPGEKIAVTGALGAAAAGMEMLDKKMQFDAESSRQLRQAFLQPEPRVAEGQQLVELGVKAAIDISDGLISDLKHVCEASRVGARVEMERIPIAPAVSAHFKDRALALAAAGGEDYELLFTASEEKIAKVRTVLSCPVTTIGEIVAEETGNVVIVDAHDAPVDLEKSGWEHFGA
ncbi:MAG: thiamine-phosphate kinase [Chloroflexota bacterium]|nr:thiamine-phosphate kinase [Chloroflexota bacterium]